MLADAEKKRRDDLARQIQKTQVTIVETDNAIMALQLAEQKWPDLIIIRTHLELQSVTQLCRALRKNPRLKNTPIIVCESRRETPSVQRAIRRSGIDAYIRYPAEPAQILPVIRNLVESLDLQQRNSALQQGLNANSRQLREINAAATRFVPAKFLSLLGRSNLADLRQGDWKRMHMAILFADIRSFATLSESITPEENFRFINSYLSRMGPVIRKHKGFIDKFIGDGIMALFPGAPKNALDAAVAMQKELRTYNRHRANCHYAPIRVGIGVHFGETIIGTVGENERLDVTVISDTVNVASRLESLSKRYGASVLVSGALLSEIPQRKAYQIRRIDCVRVKGRQNALDIFEVLDGLGAAEFSQKLRNRPALELALKAYLAGNAQRAVTHLARVNRTPADDPAVTALQRKIDQYISVPEKDRGDTVETLFE